MTDQQKPTPEKASDLPEQNVTPLQPLPTDDVRAEITDLLKEGKKKLNALGDIYFREGSIGNALAHYKHAGDPDKLIALGNRALQEGFHRDALDAYKAAGANEKIIAVGDYYLQQGNFELAAAAFTAADATSKRLAIADHFLQGIPKEQILAHLERRGSTPSPA